ncbi:thiopeptide-type bacteriocin biosynthesis protein [Flavobacterium sediminilitoris]|uniref:Thiopeptide-type bacteriocin biosynthesis protein n=1 Tax=Flavobacterium sediminilitoris TaxID=2024526 RepID=A0ABY4HNS7_9FLAO|nr:MULTISPECIES: thiopeptide-type bacteriocin biosynthesis protein [Flavobacterium]UOX34513.1 thiopeptide-type bacteriocin biosynthesis protein [Flavobacterium sediminilitoris]
MKRTFNLGSEWLYYKIYCGVKTANFILQDHLAEKIETLKAKGIIQKWFFIRYHDPESHLRLRFQITNPNNLMVVINAMQEIFNPLQEQNLIWKTQLDTYEREIERYNIIPYAVTESIFQADSEMILNYITLQQQFENPITPLLFSCLAIDSFLSVFNLTAHEKLVFLDHLQSAFKKEFNAYKNLKKEFDKHYRSKEQEINVFLTRKNEAKNKALYNEIDQKKEKIEKCISAINISFNSSLPSFLNSHVHMMLNRQYTSRQREYELLVYDHLFRYYKTCYYKAETKN